MWWILGPVVILVLAVALLAWAASGRRHHEPAPVHRQAARPTIRVLRTPDEIRTAAHRAASHLDENARMVADRADRTRRMGRELSPQRPEPTPEPTEAGGPPTS